MEQNKIGKVLKWILGIGVILWGLAVVFLSVVGGVLTVISGLLLLPPVKDMIPDFKFKKGIIALASIVFFFIGMGVYVKDNEKEIMASMREELMREQEQAGGANKQDSSQEKEADKSDQDSAEKSRKDTESEKTGSDTEKAVAKKLSKEKIRSEIGTLFRYMQNNPEKSIGDLDSCKRLRTQAEEKTFRKVWGQMLLEGGVEPMQEECWDSNSSEFEKYADITDRYISMYEGIYGKTSVTKKLSKNLNNIKEGFARRAELQEDYDGLLGNFVNTGKFYISQKLENRSDDIVNSIANSIVSYYYPRKTSDWVGHNVGAYDLPGDEDYVIRMDDGMTFPKMGVYQLTYVNTNATLRLQDSRGFENDAPIYVVMQDEAGYNSASEEWNVIGLSMEEAYGNMQNLLTSGKNGNGSVSDSGEDEAIEDLIPETASMKIDADVIRTGWNSYCREKERYRDGNMSKKRFLTYARNEIYARHGYVFRSEELNRYFKKQSWYVPDRSFDGKLSKMEQYNADFIARYQKKKGLEYSPK